MSASKEVATVGGANLPAHLRDYQGPTGTENMDRGDVTIPRLKIAQGLTAEVKEGLVKDGDLFVNLGAQVVANRGEPLRFIPLAYAKEFILWRPREDQGGGILARAKPVYDEREHRVRYRWDKPFSEFRVKLKGLVPVAWNTADYVDKDGLDQWGSENPENPQSNIAATAHMNFVVALPDFDDMVVAFSFSRTTSRAGRDLNGLLKQGRSPMFGRVFTAQTVATKNDKGEFNNVKVMPAGFVGAEDAFNFYKSVAEQFATGFTVDQSDESEGEAEVDSDAI